MASKKKPTVMDATPASQSFAEVWKALDAIRNRLDDAEDAISDLETDSADQEIRIESLEDSVDAFKLPIEPTPLADDCECANVDRIDDIEEALTSLQDALESLQCDVDTHDEDIGGILDHINELHESVRDLESDSDATVTLANLQPTFCEKLDKDPNLNNPESLNEFAALCHKDAMDNGWWSDGYPTVEEMIGAVSAKLLMIHSEISEATEELRNVKLFNEFTEPYYEDDGKPAGFSVEIVDVLIRLFDLAGYLEIDLDELFHEKLAYNRTRGHRHGGKKL